MKLMVKVLFMNRLVLMVLLMVIMFICVVESCCCRFCLWCEMVLKFWGLFIWMFFGILLGFL